MVTLLAMATSRLSDWGKDELQASIGSCAIPGQNFKGSEFRERWVQYLDRVTDVLVVQIPISSEFFQLPEIKCRA